MTKKTECGSAVKEQGKGCDFSAVISRRTAIQSRLTEIKGIISGVHNEYQDKKRTAEAAASSATIYREGVRRMRREVQTKSAAAMEENYMDVFEKKELERLQKVAADAAAVAAVCEENYRQLHEEDIALTTELRQSEFTLQVTEVLNYQGDLKSAEQMVADVQALIDREQKIIDEFECRIQSAADMSRGLTVLREDLLSNIALGKGSEADLKCLDEEIAEANKAVEAEEGEYANARSKAVMAHQALAGLMRRRSEAEEELNTLKAQREEVIFRFVMGQAEQVANEYVSYALKLTETFNQLMSLNILAGHRGRMVLGLDVESFNIPIFNLKAFDGLADRHYPGQLAASKAALSRTGIEAAVNEQKKRIAATGIYI